MRCAPRGIAEKVLFQASIRMVIIVAASALAVYYVLSEHSASTALNHLRQFTKERAERERELFSSAAENHEQIKDHFLYTLKNLPNDE